MNWDDVTDKALPRCHCSCLWGQHWLWEVCPHADSKRTTSVSILERSDFSTNTVKRQSCSQITLHRLSSTTGHWCVQMAQLIWHFSLLFLFFVRNVKMPTEDVKISSVSCVYSGLTDLCKMFVLTTKPKKFLQCQIIIYLKNNNNV